MSVTSFYFLKNAIFMDVYFLFIRNVIDDLVMYYVLMFAERRVI